MPAGYAELNIDQGTTFENIVVLTDDVTTRPINVANYFVISQMKRSYYSANVSANIICTITDSANGQIKMSMTADQTANVKAGRYLYDVVTISPSNVKTRILEGVINVFPGISR